MIPIRQLLYKIDQRLNKLSTNAHQSIEVPDKLLALNESQLVLIKRKVGANNLYKLGLDAFKKRYQDLQNLITYHRELPVEKYQSVYHTYKASLKDIGMLFPVAILATASRGNCTDRVIDIPRIIRHGDVSQYLQNANYTPSFEYQESIAEITDDNLIIYTDGTFSIDSVLISYIRYPKTMALQGSYDLYDNIAQVDVDCELADYLEDELLTLTSLELGLSTNNPDAVQASDIRLKINE